MHEKKQLVDELVRIYDGDAWHGDNLQQILNGISAENAFAKPIPAAHSIWELVLHISAWNETWAARLAGKSRTEPLDGYFPTIADRSDSAWQLALRRLERSQLEVVERINEQDEANFSKQFADRDFTLSFFLHGIVRHVVYHSG